MKAPSRRAATPARDKDEHAAIFRLLGARIKALREERGYSAALLSRKLKVDHCSLNSIERGRYGASMATIVSVAVHLQCEESDVFTFPGVSVNHDIHEVCRRASKAALLDIRSFLLHEVDPPEVLRADGDSTESLVGARVRQLREEQGVSRADLAAAIGMNYRSLYDVESGRYNISPRKLIAAAAALHVEESDLLTFPGRSLRHDIHEQCRSASRALLLETKFFATQRIEGSRPSSERE